MSLKVNCEPCQEPMVVLFQTTVSPTEVVYVMHCTKCGGRIGVQDDNAQTFKNIQSAKDGDSLIPDVAPGEVKIERIQLSAKEIRARLMGEPR